MWKAIVLYNKQPYTQIKTISTLDGGGLQMENIVLKVLTKSNSKETPPRLRLCQYEKQRPKKVLFLRLDIVTPKNSNNLEKKLATLIWKLCMVSLKTTLHLCKDYPPLLSCGP